jgi:aspartate ammonia-lyase
MPGKVNPVIPEAVAQAALVVCGNDQVIAAAAAGGNLELNQFMPLIADSLLGSLDLLARACNIFRRFCVEGLRANESRCRQNLETSTAVATALVEPLGYQAATHVVQQAQAQHKTVRQVVIEQGLMSEADFDSLVSAEKVMQLGSRGTGAPLASRPEDNQP